MEEFAHCVGQNSWSYGVDEEFRSCCEEDEDWHDADESLSDGDMEGNEVVSLRISEGQKEEGDDSLRISEVLEEDNAEPSLRISMGHEKDAEKSSTTFSEGLEETALECSGRLPGGNIQEIVSDCSLRLSKGNEELVSVYSLRLSEDFEEDVSECSLKLSESMKEEVLECALGLFEGLEHDIDFLGCSPRLCEDHEEGMPECSLIFSEDLDEDVCECSLRLSENHEEVSECSLRLSENHEEVSECSLIFSEDHKDDISECSLSLSEDPVDDDGFSVRLFFKGVSVSGNSGLSSRISGIGVVMEKSHGVPFIQIQKKLDFFVEESIAEHLALMDGLLVALRNGFRKVSSFTDSNEVYSLIAKNDTVDDQIFIALRERIHELVDKFDSFVLKLVPRCELKRSLKLAQGAVGILGHLVECPICCDGKHKSKLIEMNCTHKLCAECMCMYVENKVGRSQVPIKCPLLRCKYSFSNSLCRSYLSSTSFESLEGPLAEVEERNLWRFYCPFPDCSMLLSPLYCSSREPSMIQSNINCIECPECCRLVCARCQVPWHSLMRCEEYLHLLSEERDNGDITLHQMAQSSSWRCCQQCRQMIELAGGCYHVTCWCGHEFCLSCGAEYRDGTRTCRCERLGESSVSSPVPLERETEVWSWDCFNPLPATIDGYTEQEKAQLALIQRFLAGGISLDNHTTRPSLPRPSDSYMDTIKDLNQLPWLESFISVIGDSYQEDHIY